MIYQAGYVTEAHHFHEADGGIYYFASEKMVRCPSGWLADLQPLGRQVEDRGIGHAAAVRVLSIQAYCMGRFYSRFSRHGCHIVTDGSVLSVSDYHRLRELVPLCDEIRFTPRRTPYRFTIREGQVFFHSTQPGGA